MTKEMTGEERFKLLQVLARARDKWLRAISEEKLEKLRKKEAKRTWTRKGWVYQ